MVKKQIKKTLRGSKVGQRKVVRRKSVKAARPARKGGLDLETKLFMEAPNVRTRLTAKGYVGRLMYGVRREEHVDRVVLEHREREKRADIQEMRVALGVVS